MPQEIAGSGTLLVADAVGAWAQCVTGVAIGFTDAVLARQIALHTGEGSDTQSLNGRRWQSQRRTIAKSSRDAAWDAMQ